MRVPIDHIQVAGRYRENLGDLAPLASSIQTVGLLQPVVVDSENRLIAGQRRIEAARTLGWTEIEAVVAADLNDALRLLAAQRDENTCRKDFAPSEAVALGGKFAVMEAKAAKKRKVRKPIRAGKLPQQKKGRVTEKVAVAVGMKRKTYEKAKAVVEAAKADPERYGDIAAGMDKDGKVDRAYKAVKRKQREQAKAAVPADLPAATDRYRVLHCTFQEADVAHGSVDWIVTDPPYAAEFLPLYRDLSAFAARVLKPGGSLLLMTGQSYLPDIIDNLSNNPEFWRDEHLTYHWTLAYETPGGQAAQLWDRKVNTFWKPVLWYVKGKYAGDWVGDVCRSNANDKRHHDWGQSESGMADIIERFTYPGQTICDPFCGGGTTGVVAVRMNRLFVGIDCDGDAVATTLRRLAEVARA